MGEQWWGYYCVVISVEVEGFMVWHPDISLTKEQVIALLVLSQSNILTLIGIILQHLEDFARKCICGISFVEESA
jgi:hypothetical protein